MFFFLYYDMIDMFKYMGFRTLEINRAEEIHIKERQLEITIDDGVAVVSLEDLNQIMMQVNTLRREEWNNYKNLY